MILPAANSRVATVCLTIALLLSVGPAYSALKIGVSLHPYYSWLSNIVGDRAEVVPLIPATSDPHAYQPRPQDIQKLSSLDIVVANGAGHDLFVDAMLQAAGEGAPEVIHPARDMPLLAAHAAGGGGLNSHTFLSITGAIHQINHLSATLQRLDPDNAAYYQRNTRQYKRRLRQLLADALHELSDVDTRQVRIGTVHDGYAFLFQELGLAISAVVQPRHGVRPSPKQLADSVTRIQDAGITLLFAEMAYEPRFVQVIAEETETRVYQLSHIASGPYSAGQYEQEMAGNLRTIVAAVRAQR